MTQSSWLGKYGVIMLPDFNTQEWTVELMIVADNTSSSKISGTLDCWTAYLFNNQTQVWDNMYRSCGSGSSSNSGGPGTTGWAMHESKALNATCPTISSLGGQSWELAINGTWQELLEPGDPADNQSSPMTSTLVWGSNTCWTRGAWSIYQEAYSMGYNGWFGLTPGAS